MEQFAIRIDYSEHNILMGHVEIRSKKENSNDNHIWILDLYVIDIQRHTDIGTKLMNRVIDISKKNCLFQNYIYTANQN